MASSRRTTTHSLYERFYLEVLWEFSKTFSYIFKNDVETPIHDPWYVPPTSKKRSAGAAGAGDRRSPTTETGATAKEDSPRTPAGPTKAEDRSRRVRLALSALVESKFVRGFEVPTKRVKAPKNEKRAAKARAEGDEFLERGDFKAAIAKYSKCLRFANVSSSDETNKGTSDLKGGETADGVSPALPTPASGQLPEDPHIPEGVSNAALAYASRSAAFFELQRYEESLTDCQRALEEGYPDSLRLHLKERLEQNSGADQLDPRDPLLAEQAGELKCKEFLQKPAKDCAHLPEDHGDNSSAVNGRDKVAPTKSRHEGLVSVLRSKAGPDGLVPAPWVKPVLPQHAEEDGANFLRNYISPKVEVQLGETQGRKLVAVADIQPGEVVLIETTPYVAYLDLKMERTHCNTCLEYCDCMIPCKHCPMVMFCSKACRDSPSSPHNTECRILPFLATDSTLPHCRDVFRFLLSHGLDGFLKAEPGIRASLEAVHSGKPPLPDLNPFLAHYSVQTEGRGDAEDPAATADVTDEEILRRGRGEIGDKSEFLAGFFRLVNHLEFWDRRVIFENVAIAAYVVRCLEAVGFFESEGRPGNGTAEQRVAADRRNRLKAAELAFYVCLILKTNRLAVKEFVLNVDDVWESEARPVGAACYNLSSYINHSCHPNAIRDFHRGRDAVVWAVKRIPCGTEVRTLYAKGYEVSDHDARREHLKENYCFNCDCDACEGEWSIRSGTLYLPYLPHMLCGGPCHECTVSTDPVTKLVYRTRCPRCDKKLEPEDRDLIRAWDEVCKFLGTVGGVRAEDTSAGYWDGVEALFAGYLDTAASINEIPFFDSVLCRDALVKCLQVRRRLGM